MGDRLPAIGAVDPGAIALLIELRGECVHAAREDIGQAAQQIHLDLRRGRDLVLRSLWRSLRLGKGANRQRDQ